MLEIAGHVLVELPDLGQDRKFRKFVAKSEKALGAAESILPPTSFSFKDLIDFKSPRGSLAVRWGVIVGLCLVILAAGLAVQNEYRRQHRRIDVLNGLGKPVLVALDGGAPVEFKQAGTLPVAEGRHHVRITGAVEEEFDVDVGAGYFQRWTSSPRWVINPGGAVPLTSTTVHYAAKPGPPQVRLLVGERFVALPHVDYAFEAPPATLNVDSVQSDVVKEVLDQVSGIPPETIFRAALKSSSPDKVLTYGEAVLLRNPNDGGFSALYYNTAIGENEAARALRFLKKGLAERPVCIPWHRAYQQIEEFSGNSAALERNTRNCSIRSRPARHSCI